MRIMYTETGEEYPARVIIVQVAIGNKNNEL